MNNWEGVKAQLTDKEILEVSPRFIENHLGPAAYSIADAIDQDLNALYKDVPWFRSQQGSDVPVTDIIQARKILVDNRVPKKDMFKFFEVGTGRYAKFLDTDLFKNANESANGGDTQLTGEIGSRYDFRFFENQNVETHTPGALTAGTATALNADAALGATSIVVKDTTGTPSLTGTVKAGDTLVIAGNTQRYSVAADATASGNLITITLNQPLVQAYSENDVVTLRQDSTNTTMNLAFHKTAFALVMRPLPEVPNSTVIQDPVTGLSMRLMMWYDENTAKHWWRIDALWGVKTLDGNRAVRYESAD